MKAYSGSGIAIVLDFVIAIAFGTAAGLLFYSAVAGAIAAVLMLLIFLALSIRVILYICPAPYQSGEPWALP